MKVLHINSMAHGSTGAIMKELAGAIDGSYISYSPFDGIDNNPNQIIIGNYYDATIHHIMSRITGRGGLFSKRCTKQFLKSIEKINPDIIHIHNLHNSYINIEKLFAYINENNIPTVWTLHDCWPFTGQCAYYDMVKCYKWQSGCHHCAQINRYPKSWVDNTAYMYLKKKKIFLKCSSLYLVAPSNWMKKQVKMSFLKSIPTRVIYNAVDQSIYKPTKGSFKRENNLEDFQIILAVSNRWDERKGIQFLTELSSILNDEKMRMVIVGNLENRYKKRFEKETVFVSNVQKKEKLADIYSSADVFLNPTLEENFCLTNIEALSCGTPVVCFNTGGCPEIVDDTVGSVVHTKSSYALLDAIKKLPPKKIMAKKCLYRAALYDKKNMIQEYKKLYNQMLGQELDN